MQSGKRLSRLAIAGVAVAALVTGCGSSSGGSPNAATSPKADKTASPGKDALTPQALLAGSVDKTVAAKNAKIALSVTTSAAGKSIDITADGVVDFVDKRMALTMTLPSAAGIGGTIEERLIDKVIYVKLPASEAGALGGKAWIKLDASTLGSAGSGLDSASQNPADLLESLRNVSDSVTKLGTEDIRGVKTTHYRAEVDLSKAIKAGNTKQIDPATLAELKKVLGSSTLPEDVYLDDEGLPRRFSVAITPATGSTGAAAVGKVTTAIDFYDFGKADTASIVAPPASEVGALPTGAGLPS